MPSQVQKEKSTTKVSEEIKEIPKSKDATELKKELDDILEDIDGILEENAAEMVASYIQKGGE